MGTLHYVNGGPPPEIVTCHHCGATLYNERASAPTAAGTRFFCKTDPEHPFDSCYLKYKQRFN